MSRSATMSPLGLYNWDNTIFDLMQLPEALDRQTLVDNLLAETAELEVLYPNPVVFKNLVGVWSNKEIDVWNRLYATTQYEYNPIENYNRTESGSESGTGSTTHSGTDSIADITTYGGSDGRTEAIMHGGTDTATRQFAEGGTQGEQTTAQMAQGGSDTVSGTDEKGHWVAGFNSVASGTDDGLVKQTRDEDSASTTTNYGKTESDNGSSTTTFGKTESETDATAYGKTENVTESRTYGQTINRANNLTHGEQISNTSGGSHTLNAHGNIGVTTTQEMIRQQRSIELFNLYDIIIESFKMRFCILVY